VSKEADGMEKPGEMRHHNLPESQDLEDERSRSESRVVETRRMGCHRYHDDREFLV
jgi:hypothetical protein